MSIETPSVTSGQPYQPSGHVTPHGTLMMLLFGALAAGILGFIYGYVTQYNPLVYINFLGTLVFGAGMGLAVGAGVRQGKVRSPAVAFAASLVVGLLGLYIGWVVWTHALAVRAGASGWIIQPLALVDVIRAINENGAWSMRGYTPTGAVLWGLWAIEAVLILGVTLLVGIGSARAPFCEACGVWAEDIFTGMRLGPPSSPDQFRSQLQSGAVAALGQLPPPQAEAYTEVSLASCPTCRDVGYLTVESVQVSTDKKGKAESSKTSIVNAVQLAGAELAALLQLGQHAAAAHGSPGDVPAAEGADGD